MHIDIKQKMLIITDGGFPYGRASANYFRNLSVGLSKHYNIEVLLPFIQDSNKQVGVDNNLTGEFENINYRYFVIIQKSRYKFKHYFKRFLGLVKLYLYLLTHYRSNHVSFLLKYKISFLTTLGLIAICKIKNIKLVHIISEFYSKPSGKPLHLINWWDFYFGITYLSKYSDGIIVFSSFLKNYIEQTGFKKSIIITPNIINPTFFKSKDKVLFKDDFITIGASGTSVLKDGLLDLILSFSLLHKQYKSTHLLIIGDSYTQSFIPTLNTMVKEIGLQNAVTFTGLVDYSDIPGLLISCDILALTRPKGVFAEAGFPTKLGEYMAARKPIVVTAVGDIKKYFENHKIVRLVVPEDITSITEGLQFFINNVSESHEYANQGYNWMTENLDYQIVAERIHSYLGSL